MTEVSLLTRVVNGALITVCGFAVMITSLRIATSMMNQRSDIMLYMGAMVFALGTIGVIVGASYLFHRFVYPRHK